MADLEPRPRHGISFLRDLLGNGLAQSFQALAPILFTPLLTRSLKPSEYGVLGVAGALMVLVVNASSLNLDSAASRWYWGTRDEVDRRTTLVTWAWSVLLLSLGAFGFLILMRPWLTRWLFPEAAARIAYPWIAATVLSSSLSNVLAYRLRLSRRPLAVMSYSGLVAAGSISGIWFLVFHLGRGLEGFYQAMVAVGILGSAAAIVTMRDLWDVRQASWVRLKEMLRYSAPLVPASLATWVINLSDRFLVQFLAGGEQVGRYHFASVLSMAVGFPVTAFLVAWAPFALSIHEKKEAPLVFRRAALVFTAVTLNLSLALALGAPLLARVMAPTAYAKALPAILLLAWCHVLMGLMQIASLGAAIAKRNDLVLKAFGLGVVFNLASTALLVPRLGAFGAALATLLSYFLLLVLIWRAANRVYPIPHDWAGVGWLFALQALFILLVVSPATGVASLGLSLAVVVFLSHVTLSCFLLRWRWYLPHLDGIQTGASQ